MDLNKKRSLVDDFSILEQMKKRQSSSVADPPSNDILQQPQNKRPSFASYLDTPNLLPKTKLLCEIISNTPSLNVEKVLNDTGIRVTTEEVEEVLKLSYGFPATAVKFFRWSGILLNDKHSPYGWNLVVDLLGKNRLFDAMWDAVKSMKREGLLSLATFASVFSSYVIADRVDEAIMTFEVLDQYGIPRDVVALNSLLSAICREGKTAKAWEFLQISKDKIRPDADTYAILLEGWESEVNVISARHTFDEMVILVGWDPRNVPAYDTFLMTVLKGHDGMNEAMKFFNIMRDKRCFPGMRFFKAALDYFVKSSNNREAWLLWQTMVGISGLRPDTQLYNSMIVLFCYVNHIDMAQRFFDEMVFNGAFPDSETYNVLLQFFLKDRKLREVSVLFSEMVKNECIPNPSNCVAALRIFIDSSDPEMALKIWKCMIGNQMSDLEECGNILVVGLRDYNMLPEACKYAEDMVERGIKLKSSTLSKLKSSLVRAGKGFVYDELLKKWKFR